MTIFFISDTHFGHEAMITKFKLDDGSPARSFSSVEEMDELMAQNWCKTVKPSDHIYHLGDVSMHRAKISIIKYLPGQKRLILGNHDSSHVQDYLAVGFKKIMSYRRFENIIFSHVPIHPLGIESNPSKPGRTLFNVHGHTHMNHVMHEVKSESGWWDERDPRYLNICVEQTSYTPISLEEIKSRLGIK